MNICRVLWDATAAQNICQSAGTRNVSRVAKFETGGREVVGERTFRVRMSGVEGHAVLHLHGRIEGALDVVDGSRHEIQAELSVGVEVVE